MRTRGGQCNSAGRRSSRKETEKNFPHTKGSNRGDMYTSEKERQWISCCRKLFLTSSTSRKGVRHGENQHPPNKISAVRTSLPLERQGDSPHQGPKKRRFVIIKKRIKRKSVVRVSHSRDYWRKAKKGHKGEGLHQARENSRGLRLGRDL